MENKPDSFSKYSKQKHTKTILRDIKKKRAIQIDGTILKDGGRGAIK